MPSLTMKLTFDGYWKEKNIANVPEASGIYCVYTYTIDEINKKQKLKIHKLIFIGSTDNAKSTVLKLEKSGNLSKYTVERNRICYSFAPLEKNLCNQVKSAMIRTLNPPGNQGDKTLIENEAMQITIEGQKGILKGEMVIPKSI